MQPHEDMSPALRPEILAPTHPYLARGLAVAVGAGLVGGALAWLAIPTQLAPVPPPPLAMTETIPVPMAIPMILPAVRSTPAPERSSQVAFVFAAGGAAYLKLAELDGDDPEATPRHGKVAVHDDDYAHAAIAVVKDADVPRAHRGWAGKQVVVDGTCRANVVGFAVVARLLGDPGYAGEEVAAWDARSIMAHGTPVLAARLDGCADGVLARDAARPPIVVPEVIADAPLAAAARRAVLASADAHQAQRAWKEAELEGRWSTSDGTTWSVQVLRHPSTGDTFVSAHAGYAGGCGGPEISIWHLFRADRDGRLTRVPSSLGDLTSIERLVDLEGDGTFEVLGTPWLGTDRRVIRSTGETIERLELQFYGCPC